MMPNEMLSLDHLVASFLCHAELPSSTNHVHWKYSDQTQLQGERQRVLEESAPTRELLVSFDNGETHDHYQWHQERRRVTQERYSPEISVFKLCPWASYDTLDQSLVKVDVKRMVRLSMEAIPEWIDERLNDLDKEIIGAIPVSDPMSVPVDIRAHKLG
jgi:hypothetical protein